MLARVYVCVCVCVCVCEMSQQWMGLRQTHPSPAPHLARATQGTRGTSRVQRARRPPVWRRQLVEAAASRAAIGRRSGVQTVDSIKKDKYTKNSTGLQLITYYLLMIISLVD